jgi:hypothetical protein
MATLRDKLKDIPDVKDFAGGNDKQREHLNEITKAIKFIKDAAKDADDKDHELLKGMARTNTLAWEDGILVTYATPATLVSVGP